MSLSYIEEVCQLENIKWGLSKLKALKVYSLNPVNQIVYITVIANKKGSEITDIYNTLIKMYDFTDSLEYFINNYNGMHFKEIMSILIKSYKEFKTEKLIRMRGEHEE
ncbi:MAG: hypothetical protein QXI16_00280 [Sulfolobaceae archaeon]